LPGGVDLTLHRCSRHHPDAPPFRGYCPACLLEAALLPSAQEERTAGGSFTIEVPLGESQTASVFAVREEAAARRLLRLKRWRIPAPEGFIDGFEGLRAQLLEWRPQAIVLPVTAWVDGEGCPSVVTEFRQGMPLLDSVASGWLPAERALSGLRQLQQALDAAHQQGLAHGSVVPGNVFSARPDGAPYLLDFGLALLFSEAGAWGNWAAADREGLARIQAQIERPDSASR